jgi:LysR family transcriptional activator of nhaA
MKGHSHLLGECGVAFFATPDIASRLRTDFPSNLDGTPMLIPGEDSALRAPLMRWLERQGLRPRVIAEFDDSALMKAFGQSGAGVFPAPAAMAPELDARYGVVPLGQTEDMRERFFAISAERRLTHPAVVAVRETARSGVFRQAVG